MNRWRHIFASGKISHMGCKWGKIPSSFFGNSSPECCKGPVSSHFILAQLRALLNLVSHDRPEACSFRKLENMEYIDLRVTTRKLQKSLYNSGKVSFNRLGRPWNEISIMFNNCHNSLTFVFFLFFSVPPKINDMNRLRQHAANNWHWHWYNFRSCVRVNG